MRLFPPFLIKSFDQVDTEVSTPVDPELPTMPSSNIATEKESAKIIQYDDPHPSGRDRRGVLICGLNDEPTVSWNDLTYALASIHGAVNPNVVRFRVPTGLPRDAADQVVNAVQTAFAISFPDRSLLDVRLSSARSGFKYLDIETPSENVKAEDIILAASRDAWQVNGELLGEHQFVGFQTSKMVHAIRFDQIPHDDLGNFIEFLPELLKLIEPSVPITIVDIWRVEYKVAINSALQRSSNWVFGCSIVVLFSLPDPLPTSGRIAEIVDKWPGWYMWRNKSVIGLVFPGRYDYCGFCKYMAQNMEGDENRRHTTKMCRKLVCHYDTACTTSGYIRRR